MKKSLGARTVLYPSPVLVIGTYDMDGKPNIMTAAWGGICCSRPPCIAVSLRKATYTYGSIVERKAFSVNVPSAAFVAEVDYVGLASGRSADKFAVSGLTAVPGDLVDAPYVKEFPLTLECRLLQTIEIGLHTQFIGEIMDAKVDESALDGDGLPAVERIQPLAYAHEVRAYFAVGQRLGKAFSMGRTLRGY